MLNEIDHYLALDEKGVREYSVVDGLNNRVEEWFMTPMNTVADNPSWGHNLRPYWYDPQSQLLVIQIEMAIVRKLPQDVRDVTIRRVRVEFPEVDKCLIEIWHDLGIFKKYVDMTAAANEVSNGIF